MRGWVPSKDCNNFSGATLKGVCGMKKTFDQNNRKSSIVKRALLAAMLVCAVVAMSSCMVEPDRVVDDPANANIGGAQQFQTVVTNTPVPTNTPSPTPAQTDNSTNVDWDSWTFGDNTATNPPSNQSGQNPITITVGPATDKPSPAPTLPSGGSSSVQRLVQCLQRGAKRQPLGISNMLGTVPSITFRSSSSPSRRGMDSSRPMV